jgi:light-regulated signal transduction histidine kinase (bacteriophytochrome)
MDCFEKRFKYIEHVIEVRIESLKMELDNNANQLVNKINNLIRNKGDFNQKPTKQRCFLKINEHKRNKKLKINLNKIGFICLQLNKKIEKDVWRSKNIEELIQKICTSFNT